MGILTKQEAEVLNQAKAEFVSAANGQQDALKTANAKHLKNLTACVETAIDSFGSETFIVSCVGMLKSGKSTLVNLFARNNLASPTGYGFDTTLRPALITECAEAEGCIEIWLQKNQAEALTKSVFDKLFTYLRGVGSVDNVEQVSRHTYPLTEANLINALCKKEKEADNNMLPSEPVLVVVKVPHRDDSLLSSEIMILDTPGLDSGLSEWTSDNTGRYSWIISNSDLLLFLQSSVAPLNEKATKILKDIQQKNSSVPIWLVQNEMLTKPWLPEERIKETTANQRARACKMFNKVSCAFKQFNTNLGKADSAILDEKPLPEDRDGLLAASQFPSMEKNIREDLAANIAPIRRGVCRGNVRQELNKLTDLLQQEKNAVATEMEQMQQEIAERETFKESVRDILLDPPQGRSFAVAKSVLEIQTLAAIPFKKQEFTKLLRDAADFDFDKERYSCGELKQTIETVKKKLVNKMTDALSRTALEHFTLSLQSGNERQNNIARYLKTKFGKFANDLVIANYVPTDTFRDEMKRLLKECAEQVKLPDFPVGVNVDVRTVDRLRIEVEKLPTIWNCSHLELERRNQREAQTEFLRYYDVRKQEGLFVKLIDQCETVMKENLLQWLNQDAYEAMRGDFITKICEQVDRIITEKRDRLSLLQNDDRILTEIENGCEKLAASMEDL